MGTRVRKTRIVWNPDVIMGEATEEGMRRLSLAAEVLKAKTEANLKAIIKNPTYSRPVYQTGPYAGKYWTARIAGELLRSVRIVKSTSKSIRNVWVMVGQRMAYYASMFEFATDPKRGKRFFRPAIAASKAKMKSIIERGE